jgi:hypothetical protein
MTAKIIRYRDPERKSRHADSVDRDPGDSAIIIVLPIIRIERYAEPKPRRRVKALRRPT